MDTNNKIIITKNNWFVETDSFCEIIDPREEYWCDSFSMKLCPDVNVKNTFLGKYNESDDNFYSYEMSHPTYFDRITNILNNNRYKKKLKANLS